MQWVTAASPATAALTRTAGDQRPAGGGAAGSAPQVPVGAGAHGQLRPTLGER